MTDVEERVREKVKIGSFNKVRVIMYNDDTTTFEFVIGTLKKIFCKSDEIAETLAGEAHVNGSVVVCECGKKRAVAKVKLAMDNAKFLGFNDFTMKVEE